MIRVIIPLDEEYQNWRDECKKLYQSVQDKINDVNSYDFVEHNTLLYVFVDESGLIGVTYFFLDDEKLFMNGFSKRKKYPLNVECIKISSSFFKSSVYAEVQNRASAFCLLKAGFKRIEPNLMVFENPSFIVH